MVHQRPCLSVPRMAMVLSVVEVADAMCGMVSGRGL